MEKTTRLARFQVSVNPRSVTFLSAFRVDDFVDSWFCDFAINWALLLAGCQVVKTYCGHGIGELFHTLPTVPHYPKNKAKGVMKPGHIFTIEPMINLGTWQASLFSVGW